VKLRGNNQILKIISPLYLHKQERREKWYYAPFCYVSLSDLFYFFIE
jgi:hypothetical protein